MTEDAQPTSRPLPDLIGGRYRIVSRLGVGGMGIVYKAVDTQLNRAVAVKALEDRRLLFPGGAGRLKAEALAAASLDHPYICKVYELLEGPTETFIVMEFVEGETLSSMLKRGVLPLLQTLQIGREVAEGLATAHQRGLVHRDVKPSNVMVTTTGHVKLLDFGIAGADVETLPAEQTRTVSPLQTVNAGTPQYMAPEQAAGQPVTTRADLFSLGVLLYECVTGSLPFSGTTTFDYVRHVMQSAPRRLDRLAPDTPADLVDLIDKCLEKTPADRPDSAATVVTALRRLQDALTSPHASVRTARQMKTGRRWQVVAAGAVGLAAIALGWRFLGSDGTPVEPTFRLRPFVTTSAVESKSRISTDGQWMSFLATAGGVTRILVQRIDGGDSRPLTLGPGQPVSQAWSPDGNQIAAVLMVDGVPVLQIYPAFFGGAPVQSIPIDTTLESIGLLCWIGRDLYLAANIHGQAGLTVRRISLDSPAVAATISDAWKIDGTLRSVDIRRDGRAVVVSVSRNSQEDLWTLNLDGSGLRQMTADAFFDRHPLWIGSGDRVVFQSNRGGQVDLWRIDTRTKALTPLTTGETEEIADSSSADGQLISYEQLTKDANLWAFGGVAPQQLTQDSLSDYSPAVSGDGRVIAFQRSQPTPSRGYTILDAKVFVAPFDGRAVAEAKATADGFAPDLSSDGQWLAYMQMSDVPKRMRLAVRDLRAGGTVTVSSVAALPSLLLAPVEWATRLTAWSRSGADLFFVDQPDAHAIRRYHAGDAAAGPPLMAVRDAVAVRDLSISPQTGHLAFIVSTREGVTARDLDPATGAVADLAKLAKSDTGLGLIGRGWLDRRFVLVRYGRFNDDGTADVEILTTNDRGGASIAGRITQVYPATLRLHAARRALYMTRSEHGTDNVYAFAFDSGGLTAVTQNTLPGVTFSGFQPAGQKCNWRPRRSPR